MRAVDTNLLVRLIARDHELQTSAAMKFIEGGAWVSVLVLAETIWVLEGVYHRDASELAGIVEGLLSHKTLILQDSEIVAKALDLFRSRPALGFADCMILELARKAGHLPLGTFDRALGKADGAQRL